MHTAQFALSSRSESQLGAEGRAATLWAGVHAQSHHPDSPSQMCPGAHLPGENTNILLSNTQQKHSIPKPKGHREDPTLGRW